MGLFRKKVKAEPMPLALPMMNSLTLPDLAVFRKHRDVIDGINMLAMHEGQQEGVKEAARPLAVGLYEAFGGSDDVETPEDEQLLGAIGMSTCVGIGYAVVDNGMGVPRGFTDRKVHTALLMGAMALDGFPKQMGPAVFFSMQAGHYMGRHGSASTGPLIAAAYS